MEQKLSMELNDESVLQLKGKKRQMKSKSTQQKRNGQIEKTKKRKEEECKEKNFRIWQVIKWQIQEDESKNIRSLLLFSFSTYLKFK